MAVYLCPVCHGKGIVKHDFYNLNGNNDLSSTCPNKEPIICRTCNGEGVLWDSKHSYSPLNSEPAKQERNFTPVLNDGFLGKVKD